MLKTKSTRAHGWALHRGGPSGTVIAAEDVNGGFMACRGGETEIRGVWLGNQLRRNRWEELDR